MLFLLRLLLLAPLSYLSSLSLLWCYPLPVSVQSVLLVLSSPSVYLSENSTPHVLSIFILVLHSPCLCPKCSPCPLVTLSLSKWEFHPSFPLSALQPPSSALVFHPSPLHYQFIIISQGFFPKSHSLCLMSSQVFQCLIEGPTTQTETGQGPAQELPPLFHIQVTVEHSTAINFITTPLAIKEEINNAEEEACWETK